MEKVDWLVHQEPIRIAIKPLKIVFVKDGEIREEDLVKLEKAGLIVVVYRNVKPKIVEV